MTIKPGDRGHVAEHNGIDGRLDALEALPPGTSDPAVAALVADPESDTGAALTAAIGAVAQPVVLADSDVQAAIADGLSDSRDVYVAPGTHYNARSTSGERASFLMGTGTLKGQAQASALAVTASDPIQTSLSHLLKVGTESAGADSVTVDSLTLTGNQSKVNKQSRIVSRLVASDNSYCEVTTATPHGLNAGDSVTITLTELAALNATFTVSAAPTATTFRVTGVSSSNHALVSELPYLALVTLTGAASIDGVTSLLLSTAAVASTRVQVRNCKINDVSNAVRCTRTATAPDVMHADWLVENCRGSKFSNKVVEFGFLDGGVAVGNRFTECVDGLQAIFWSRNVRFERNYTSFTASGLNLTSGVHDIDIVGNTVEPAPDVATSSTGAALTIRTENTSGAIYTCYNIRSRGNTYRNRTTTAQLALAFRTLANVTSSEYYDMTFDGDTFDGVVQLYEAVTPAKTTIHGLRFDRCRIGALTTTPYSTSKVYDVAFRNCDFTDTTATTIHASNIQFVNCAFKGAVTIGADAADIVMTGCTTPTAITDSGTRSTLAGNLLAPSYPI